MPDPLQAVRCAFTGLVLVLAAATVSARASITYDVSFDDPGGAFSSFYEGIVSHARAAGNDWARHLAGSASLEVLVQFDPAVPTALGGSVGSAIVGSAGPISIVEQGATSELRTGIDPNGTTPDVIFILGSSFLTNDLWFDPDPAERTALVPIGAVDAMSIFLHEFGHVFAFNGARDPTTGELPGPFESTFDVFTTFENGSFFFTGPRAVGLYGGPVPLTFGNYKHLGNEPPRAGGDLVTDLMNGVSFVRGARYDISDLDLAIFADVGVPRITAIPEPSTWALWGLGLTALLLDRLRRRRRAARQVTCCGGTGLRPRTGPR
jgi:hypothetical protein